jgi:hypothetical protein
VASARAEVAAGGAVAQCMRAQAQCVRVDAWRGGAIHESAGTVSWRAARVRAAPFQAPVKRRDVERSRIPYLDRRNVGRQAQPAVVAVCHDDAANETRAHSPRRLVHVLLLVVLIQEFGAEGARKVVPQIVRRARL